MADLMQDFGTYFISQGLTTLQTFFTDMEPASPDTVVIVNEYQGQPGMPQIEGAMRSIQVVARDKNAAAARAKALALYKSLQTEEGILNLTAGRWCMIGTKQTPFKIKVDGLGRSYYVFNLAVTTYTD